MDKIGFSTRDMFLSKFIRWMTRSKVSHTWLLYYDKDFECDMVMEATFEGFRILPFETFKTKNTVIAMFEPKHSLDPGFKIMCHKIGESYNIKGLLGAMIPIIGKYFKRKWHNPTHSTSSLFCSEAMVEVMKDSNYPGSEALIPQDMNPEELYEFFVNENK